MDKKRQMVFNLNNFLLAFSEVLNSKKVAYIALNLGIKFGFDNKKLAIYDYQDFYILIQIAHILIY